LYDTRFVAESVTGPFDYHKFLRFSGSLEQTAGMTYGNHIIFAAVNEYQRPGGYFTDVVNRCNGYKIIEPGLSRLGEIRIPNGAYFTIMIDNSLSVAALGEKGKISRTGAGSHAAYTVIPGSYIYRGCRSGAKSYQIQSAVSVIIQSQYIIDNRLQVAGPPGHVEITAAVPGSPEIKNINGIFLLADSLRQYRIATVIGVGGITRRYAVTETDNRVSGIFSGQELLTYNGDAVNFYDEVFFIH
jgi:hypothetical protein